MKRDINDLLDERLIDIKDYTDGFDGLDIAEYNLTSLKGIEKFEKIRDVVCSSNNLTSLKGIEKLKNLKYLDCSNNNLSNLIGIEKLNNLDEIYFSFNPCASKYIGLSAKQVQSKVFSELHLNKDDELRGKASVIDTGLFDFKIK